jgi:hypothetical protein
MTGVKLNSSVFTRMLILFILVIPQGMHTTSLPVRASSLTANVPFERLLNPNGTLNLNSGFQGELDLRGWDVSLDSKLGPILSNNNQSTQNPVSGAKAGSPIPAQSLGWIPLLHNPMSGGVNAISIIGNDLYIGGNFTFIPDGGTTNLNHIAKYSNGVWSALANNGLNSTVNALAVIGTDLYVGGSFNTTADGTITNLSNIAKYDTVGNAWSSMPHLGVDGFNVFALAAIGSDLYVGGNFSATADGQVTNLNGIAKYSGGVWSPLAHKGLEGEVHALAVSGTNLCVGGNFAETYDIQITNLNNIALYSGGAWSALANTGLDSVVNALAVNGSDLYVGGVFTKTKDNAVVNLHHVAKYGSGGWSAFQNNGVNGLTVRALAINGSVLYIGGSFSATFDNVVTNLNNIASYNTSSGAWSALPNRGLSDEVDALLPAGSDLFVGGSFGGTGDGQYTGQIVKLGALSSIFIPLVQK